MGASGMLPGRGPPIRGGILHDSERTRVTRLSFAGRTVVRKEPLGPDTQRRLQHELAILNVVSSGHPLASHSPDWAPLAARQVPLTPGHPRHGGIRPGHCHPGTPRADGLRGGSPSPQRRSQTFG
jgi:hypothetical protein